MTMFDMTVQQAADSLNGFDMLEIKKRFGEPWTGLDSELKATALFYIQARRADDSFTFTEAMQTDYATIRDAFKPADDDATFPGAPTGA